MKPQVKFFIEKALYCISQKQIESAKFYLNQAIKVDPNNSEIARILGVCFYFAGQHEVALNYFEQAINLNNRNANAYNNRATLLFEKGQYEIAIQTFNKAVELDKNNHEIRNNLGNALQELKRYEEAIICFERAIALKPSYPEAYINLGNTLQKLDKFTEAINCYQKAIQIRPDYAEAYLSYGKALQKLNKIEEAIKCYKSAIDINQNFAEAYDSLGNLMYAQGNLNNAKEFFLKSINADPIYSDGHLNLGCILLEQFEFKLGWVEYEWRNKTKDYLKAEFKSSKPRWNEKDNCLRLLIMGEQGIGDQILHGSIMSELQNTKMKIIVALNKKLISIFSRTFPKYEFVDFDSAVPEVNYDCYINLASLGKIYRNKIEDFPKNNHLFVVDENKRQKLKHSFTDNSVYCGISWKSNNEKIGDKKSIDIETLSPIFNISGINFVNLQYGLIESDLNKLDSVCKNKINLFDEIDKYGDIDGVAALIDCCDFVITSSNSVAHLSGALGKQTFLLLPRATGKFWYWHALNNQSIWYPSVRIFQQKVDGDWTYPISELKKFLEDCFAK